MQTIISNIPITTAKLPKALHLRHATLYYLRLEFNSTVTDNSTGAGNGNRVGNNATSCGNGTGSGNGSGAGNGNGNGSSQRVAAAPLTVYKLGYTTTSLHERVHGHKGTYRYGKGKRICLRPPHNGMGLPPGTMVYVISTLQHRNGALVYQWEQYLHRKHATQRYIGPPPMTNGNTELYTTDILDLDW